MTATLEANMQGSKCTFTQEIDGDLYNIHFDANVVREALTFKPKNGDIIQMSYASSGTRWMQRIIQLIVYKGDSAKSLAEFGQRSLFLENRAGQLNTFDPTPRLIITHIRPGKLPTISEAKYVYVARNPWDVCCSLYDLHLKLFERADRMSFEDYVSMFLDGRAAIGPYFEHVQAGYVRRNEPNFFFVTYEEMIKDCGGFLLRLADFLGGDYGELLRREPKLLSDVIRKCSPSYMSTLFSIPKEKFVEMVFKNPNISREAALRSTVDMEDTVTAVRKAKIGYWRETFSKSTLRLALDKINSNSQAKFVKELWGDIYDEVLCLSS